RSFMEIKPFSIGGIIGGEVQIGAYEAGLAPYKPDQHWVPSSGAVVIYGKMAYVANYRGPLFYSDRQELTKEVAMASSFVVLRNIIRNSKVRSSVSIGATVYSVAGG